MAQHLRICEDRSECRRVWERIWPRAGLFDLWEVRACFDAAFDRPPRFLVLERDGDPVGLLALSWIAETSSFGHFPGETWQGRTWLEGNRIPAHDAGTHDVLLAAIPDGTEIRYLVPDAIGRAPAQVDEIGYLFYPAACGGTFGGYVSRFSRQSRKRLGRECDDLAARGLTFRHDRLADVEHLVDLNLSAFGSRSYFADARFLDGFERVLGWLLGRRALRVTTALVGGVVAAVDVGATWRRHHAVFAGGTSPEFPGIAKVINFHHIEWACAARLASVDFLCGDFGWKRRFHLSPRPLYRLEIPAVTRMAAGSTAVACSLAP